MPRRTKGCRTCKRLKIGCDSRRPSCGYCVSTSRVCEYADPTPAQDGPVTSQIAVKSDGDYIIHSPLAIIGPEKTLSQFYTRFVLKNYSLIRDQSIQSWVNIIQQVSSNSGLLRSSYMAYTALLIHKFTPHRQWSDSLELTSLYETMEKNFQLAITQLHQTMVVASQSEEEAVKIQDKSENICAIFISGFFIFLYLCRHPHRLMPLVAFDDDEGPKLHLLGFTKGLRETILMWLPQLISTRYEKLCVYASTGLLNVQRVPLLAQIGDDIDDDYIPPAAKQALQQSFAALNSQLYQMAVLSFNLELPKFFLLVPNEFFELVQQRNFFALRLVYVYSCLMLMMEFYVSDSQNMWLDYTQWYRQYNIKICDRWMYAHDDMLYQLTVVHKLRFPLGHYTKLLTATPDELMAMAQS